MCDDLQQMVLHDVADRADFLVKLAAAADAEALGHRDLHVVDVVAVPDRLEERIRKAEEEQVLHRLLAEVVIDAIDGLFVETAMQRFVQFDRRGQVAAERLLDDDAGAIGAAGIAELIGRRREQARRQRQVMQRVLRVAERGAQPRERLRIR